MIMIHTEYKIRSDNSHLTKEKIFPILRSHNMKNNISDKIEKIYFPQGLETGGNVIFHLTLYLMIFS